MNFAPTIAALRHVGSYVAGIVTALMLFGMSHDDAVKLAEAISTLSKGLADILQALGVITPILLALWAARSGTRKAQVSAVANMPIAAANAAVASLPNEAKAAIKMATISDDMKIAAVTAMPEVTQIKVVDNATNGVAKALADSNEPKVVPESKP